MTDTLIDVLGHYPTGVVIITGIAADGTPVGVMSRSFAPVSRVPAVVSFNAADSTTFAKLRSARSFCVNLIAADFESLCREFDAAEAAGDDAFESVTWRPSGSGAPILDGVLSWIDCSPRDVIPVGDRFIVLGEVSDFDAEREFLPLLHFQEGFGRFAPGSLALFRTDGMDEVPRLVDATRDHLDLLAKELGAECSVLIASGGDQVFVATSNYSNRASPIRLGLRAPLVPPIGALFVDTDGGVSRGEWLSRLPDPTPDSFDLAAEQLSLVRRRGWSISLNSGHTVDELDAMVARYTAADAEAAEDTEQRRILRDRAASHELVEIDPSSRYDVLQLAVPVRSSTGQVLCTLRLGDLPQEAYGSEVEYWLQQLQETAQAVEQSLAVGDSSAG